MCIFHLGLFGAVPAQYEPLRERSGGRVQGGFLAFLPCLHRVANSSELRFRLFYRWHALQFVLPFSRPHLSFVDWTFALRGPGGYMDC